MLKYAKLNFIPPKSICTSGLLLFQAQSSDYTEIRQHNAGSSRMAKDRLGNEQKTISLNGVI